MEWGHDQCQLTVSGLEFVDLVEGSKLREMGLRILQILVEQGEVDL